MAMFSAKSKANGGGTGVAENAAPASGIMMLLKAMGFDPDKFMGEVNAAKADVAQVVKHFDARLARIEAQQAEILKRMPEPLPVVRTEVQ